MKQLKKELDKQFLEKYGLKDGSVFKLISKEKPNKVCIAEIKISAGEVGFIIRSGYDDLFFASPRDVITLLRHFGDYDIVTLKHVPLKYTLCERDCSHCPIKTICDDFGKEESDVDKLWEKFEKSKNTAKMTGKFDYIVYGIIEKRLEQEVWQEK